MCPFERTVPSSSLDGTGSLAFTKAGIEPRVASGAADLIDLLTIWGAIKP